MKLRHVLFIVLLCVALSTTAAYYVSGARQSESAAGSATRESRLDRIKHTGVLRCGYQLWPPVMMKDANTGQMSGMLYDLVEEIGRQLSVKIEWTTEMATAQAFADLNLGKYDMGCMAFLITPGRAREGSLSTPILYWPTYLYARADDMRFDNNYEKANDPSITFATWDGEFSSIGAKEHFPKAKTASIPQISSSSELFNLIAGKKADLIVTEPLTFLNYLEHNPGSVRQVKGKPVYVGATSIALPSREPDLKEAIDGTLIYLLNSGFIDKLLDKYERPGLIIPRVAKPYTMSEETSK